MISITSKERKEARYQRRKTKRLEKKKRKITLEELFSYENLYHAGLNCFKNVGWKQSIQVYRYQLVSRTAKTRQDIINGVWKSKGFHKFTISERGKRRNISSVDIEERIVQKCICDNALVESFSSSFIYDNGASLKGKGSDFTMDRLNCHLQRYYRKYGVEGYVLLFDLTDFFNSAPHKDVAKEILIRFEDVKIANFIIQLMKNYGDVGFGLGSQTSQIECLMVLNGLDHMIKEKLRIKGYGRYNDDAYLIHNDKEYLEYCLEVIKEYCNKLGIKINEKKTKIVPIKKGFRFLKVKFTLTETGKVLRKANKESAKRMRKKFKSFRKWIIEETFTYKDAQQSYNSWKGHMKRCNSYKILKKIDKEFKNMFDEFLNVVA